MRLRNEGDSITLSYKQLNDRTLHGTKEVQIVVNDYDLTKQLLQDIGLKVFALQETRREKWMLGETEVVIDTWPWVPVFTEIEGPTEEDVKKTADLLGLDWSQALHGSVEIVYQAYYNVTDQDIYNWPEIVFSPVPNFLQKKSK